MPLETPLQVSDVGARMCGQPFDWRKLFQAVLEYPKNFWDTLCLQSVGVAIMQFLKGPHDSNNMTDTILNRILAGPIPRW